MAYRARDAKRKFASLRAAASNSPRASPLNLHLPQLQHFPFFEPSSTTKNPPAILEAPPLQLRHQHQHQQNSPKVVRGLRASNSFKMVQISEIKGNNRENRTAAHTHIRGLGLKSDGTAEKQASGFVGQAGAREVCIPKCESTGSGEAILTKLPSHRLQAWLSI